MKVVLVRHGQTDYNKQNKLQGQTNTLLNDTGRRQCKKLKSDIRNVNFDICFSSPLLRAIETAMILVGDRVEIRKDNRLIERSFGKLEGINRDKYPSKKYWNYDLNSSDDEVEKVQDLFKRVEEFINYLEKNFSDKSILIVAHGAVLRAIHCILKKENYKNSIPMFNIPNCYIEIIEK